MTKSKLTLFLVAILGIFIAPGVNAQEWLVGSQNMNFNDPSRGNRLINTKIYYPADIAGVGTALGSPSDKKFPVIVFGHDEAVVYQHYTYLWADLAAKGFILVFPKTENGPNMDVVEFGKDMAFLVDQFVAMHNNPASFFYHRYMGTSSVMGHGKGASAAIFAAQYSTNITTLVALAPAPTIPSTIVAASLVSVPSVIIGGGEDCNAPIVSNGIPIYNNIDSDCKYFVNLLKATHCHFAQNDAVCMLNVITCLGTPTTSVSTNWNTNYLVVSFLRYYLKYNAPALAKFEWKLGSKSLDWSFINGCNVVNTPRLSAEQMTDENNPVAVNFYPNPVKSGNNLHMVIGTEEATKGTVMITNLMGQVVSTQDVTFEDVQSEIDFPAGKLSKGNYLVSVITNDGKTTKPLIIQ